MRRKSRTAALLLAASLLPACFSPDGIVPGRGLTSNVVDWRDAVIYQLLVDRFADGDPNNNHFWDPTNPAGFHGGDWQGVIDHIDYLQALGVTAVWISPVVKNVEMDAGFSSYHGYWTQDFLSPNPHFGDLAKLREMVDRLHAAGIAVVLDVVVNHLGQLFYYDINKNNQPDEFFIGEDRGSSTLKRVTEWDPDYDERGVQSFTMLGESGLAPIRWVYLPEINRMPPLPEEFRNPNWYNRRGRVTVWENPWVCDRTADPATCRRRQEMLGDFPGGLKDINTSLPEVRAKMIEIFSWWIDVADFDGFRIDTLKHVEPEFYEQFSPAIRAHAKALGKDNFFIFGEAFDGDDRLIGSYTFNAGIDSVFYFSQKYQVFHDVFMNGGPTAKIEALYRQRFGTEPGEGESPDPGCGGRVGCHYAAEPSANGPVDADGNGIPSQRLLVNFLDNHDVARFLYDKPSVPHLRAALFHLFATDGIPCLYYGTEQEFAGGNDPANREDLWSSGYDTSGPTFAHVRDLIDLRRSYAALRRGDLEFLYTTSRTGDEPDAGIVAYLRTYARTGERALVVLNAHAGHPSYTAFEGTEMATPFPAGTVVQNVWQDDDPNDRYTVGPGGALTVRVEPLSGKVFVPVGAE